MINKAIHNLVYLKLLSLSITHILFIVRVYIVNKGEQFKIKWNMIQICLRTYKQIIFGENLWIESNSMIYWQKSTISRTKKLNGVPGVPEPWVPGV